MNDSLEGKNIDLINIQNQQGFNIRNNADLSNVKKAFI